MEQGKERERGIVEPWLVEQGREIMRAQGRLLEFDVETIDKDELREIVENAERSRRMREAPLSITREPGAGLSADRAGAGARRFIWEQVSGW